MVDRDSTAVGRHPGKSYLFLLTTERKSIRVYITCIDCNCGNGLSREAGELHSRKSPSIVFITIEVLLLENN